MCRADVSRRYIRTIGCGRSGVQPQGARRDGAQQADGVRAVRPGRPAGALTPYWTGRAISTRHGRGGNDRPGGVVEERGRRTETAGRGRPQDEETRTVARRTDGFGDEQPLGPRHGADDGAGRRALEAYAEYEGLPAAPPPRKRFIDYPRAGRRRWTRWLPSWRLVTSTFLLGIALVTGAVLYGYMTTQLPARENTGADFRTT